MEPGHGLDIGVLHMDFGADFGLIGRMLYFSIHHMIARDLFHDRATYVDG